MLIKEKINDHDKSVLNKEAGLDVGINNLFAILINDKTSKSLIMSGKSVISYNVNFNKRLNKINTQIKNEVAVYKQIIDKNNKTYQVQEIYTQKGKALIDRRGQLYERRKLFFNDCYQKSSKKVLEYLKLNNINKLVISKNLNFTKTTGEINYF